MSAEAGAAGPFLDTNVLIYALAQDDPRATTAQALLMAGGVVSVQVLNEFAAVARRKLDMAWDEIEQALAAVIGLCAEPRPLTASTHRAAVALARTHQLNFYDALIVAAAAESGCRLLYSEDMHDGLALDGVTIRNPFAAA